MAHFIELTVPLWSGPGHIDDSPAERPAPMRLTGVKRISVNAADLVAYREIEISPERAENVKALCLVRFRREIQINSGCSDRYASYVLESKSEIDDMLSTRPSPTRERETASPGEAWWQRL